MTGRRTAGCALALVLLAGAASQPSAVARAAQPQVGVSPVTASVGQSVAVTLTGWPTGNVQLEICGNRARRGTLDCATAGASQLYLPGADPVSTRITVVAPPVACPCVIRVRTLGGGGVPTSAVGSAAAGGVTGSAAVEIVGTDAPVAPADGGPARLRVTELAVVPADWDWPSLFALPSQLVIDLEVGNDGSADVSEARMSLLVGRPDRPTVIVDAPELAGLAAGQRRTVRIAVPLDAPVYGRYAVHGQIHGGAAEGIDTATGVAFVAEAERYPWGWAAVAGILVLVLLLRQLIPTILDWPMAKTVISSRRVQDRRGRGRSVAATRRRPATGTPGAGPSRPAD
ncbi:hypothetical protein ACN27F_24175 [Solwaraspora sp. WMMB335]|uniref:hypothetical protein n=1 Tax=Solwaraspora sp. WMMB335 TaxID=3404118 RepID=UPI003B9511F0